MDSLRGQGLAFLTAPNPTLEQLNRALVLLTDFEYTNGMDDMNWMFLRHATLDKVSLEKDAVGTQVPFPSDSLLVHDFAGKDWSQVADFAVANMSNFDNLGLNARNFIVIDQEGLDTDTVMLVSRELGDERPDYTVATRLPMDQAWLTWTNLDIANMNFEEFVDMPEEAEGKPGVYTFHSIDDGYDERRMVVLRKLRDDGLIDSVMPRRNEPAAG